MKEYVYEEKKVTINGKKYDGIFPKKHSTIEGLVFEVMDDNANDSWANIPDYHTFCAIKKKGEKKWDVLSDNLPTSDFYIGKTRPGTSGIFDILYVLEEDKVKDRIDKKEEIKELRERIKRDTKRLKELL